MSVKTTLDAIDLIAARCRIWAASMLTLFVGFEALDITGALDGLIPPGSVWHKIVPIVGMLVARYTHSKQSATAVIEAKADERTTPVTPMGALPAVALLLMASTAFAACGTAPDQPSKPDEAVTATQSAASWSGGNFQALGAYYCSSTNEVWYIDQHASQTISRRCCGLSNLYNTDLNGNASANANYNRVAFVCPRFYIPVSPTCGSNGRLCSTAYNTCQMYSRRANTAPWLVSGNISAGLAYLPDWNPSKGLWELVATPLGGGNGDGLCQTGWPQHYFDFES